MEQALLRRKEARSDKNKAYRNGPSEMIWTSLFNREGARNDKEQALSRRKAACSEKYMSYRTGPPEMIRTSHIKPERSQK